MDNVENKNEQIKLINEYLNDLNEKHTAQKKLINAVHEKNELLQSRLDAYNNSITLVLNNNVLGHMLKDMLKNEDVQTRIKTWIAEDITNRQDELTKAVQELRAEGVTDLVERVEELENMDFVYENESSIENVIDNYISYHYDYVEESDVENMIDNAVDKDVIDEAIHVQLERERRHTHDYIKSVMLKNTLSYKVKKKLKGLRVVWYNFKNKVRFKRLRTILNLSKLNGKQLEELQTKKTEIKKAPAKKAPAKKMPRWERVS
tara:strand:+ start:476 stop:1261 length:786 start_codon:yes stop_codon:yes gene_type:complete